MRRIGPTVLLSAALGTLLWLAGCTNGSDSAGASGSPAPGTSQGGQFAGIALPSSYSLDSGKSLALGVGERWIGRIVFTSGTSSGDMFDFYRSEMPKYGWSEGAVVQISSRTLGGAYVEMVVSPNGAGDAGSNTTQGFGNDASTRPVPVAKPAAHPPGVSVQPLQ